MQRLQLGYLSSTMAWTRRFAATCRSPSLIMKLASPALPTHIQRCLWTRVRQSPDMNHGKRRLCTTRAEFSRIRTEVETAGKEAAHSSFWHFDSDNDGRVLKITWADNSVSRYNTSWLRYNCHCDQCKQPHSGQKMVNISDFPSKLTIHSATFQNNSSALSMRCNEEEHECILPTDWLRQHSYSKEALQRKSRLRDITYLDGAIGTFMWEDISESEDALFEWLDHLNVYGVTLIKRVPVSHESVTTVGRLIGPITDTLYGLAFDVISEAKPINAAYSPIGLDFHVDLAYYESPPGLQLLHCLQFDDVVTNGETIFVDSFDVAKQFQEQHPEHFETLTRVPATFQKFHFERANPAAYIYQRPHINVSRTGQITAVTWAPAFEGPLSVPEEDVEPYYEAYRLFSAELETSKKVVAYRLQQGDCIIFNNRRILHGRTEFEQNGGVRHLKGCYVNIDDFRSKIQYLHEKRGLGQLAKRVGNQCMF